MAKKINVQLVDDFDGGKADQTVQFSFEGTNYEIDLSNKNLKKFRGAIAPYIDKGQKVAKTRAKRGTAKKTGPSETATIRAWAKKNGQKVSERGRIHADVIAAYRKATK